MNLELSNTILTDKSQRYCEIYRIVNLTTGKKYIGQAVSHILNNEMYRPYGREVRFRRHISEAFSKKKCQCHYLNNAIRKYGPVDFIVEHIEYCPINIADEREIFHIENENTIFPNGYNLTIGGSQHNHTPESKKRVSNGVMRYYKEQKFDRFMKLNCHDIQEPYENYIRPLRRYNNQYGWYVFIKKCKADFGGVHITLDDSYRMALEFVKELKDKLATLLVVREIP